jgi:hypothetical protein
VQHLFSHRTEHQVLNARTAVRADDDESGWIWRAATRIRVDIDTLADDVVDTAASAPSRWQTSAGVKQMRAVVVRSGGTAETPASANGSDGIASGKTCSTVTEASYTCPNRDRFVERVPRAVGKIDGAENTL